MPSRASTAVPTARGFRILVVAPEAPPVRSGIASVVGYLAKGLERRGHRVDVIAYPDVGRLAFGEIRLSRLIFKAPRLVRRIDDYDVIHIHGATPTVSDVALLLASRHGHRPAVIYTHHMDLAFAAASPLTTLYNYLHGRLAAGADAVVATTRDNLRLSDDDGRGQVIALGVDLDHFATSGPKDTRFTVLFIGQFRSYKGVPVLLEALSHVPEVRLLLAGHGPEEHAYRSRAERLGLDVEFHVDIDDDQLRHLYRRAHAVVLPAVSRREAFGLVLVEGMAAGCIPIASNLPGIREVVARSGFVFPSGDATRLAGIMQGLYESPNLVRRLASCARSRAAEFSRAHTIDEYNRLISGLVACRDLRSRLADAAPFHPSALCRFVAEIAAVFDADWGEMVLRRNQLELASVASMESLMLRERNVRRVSPLLAWYAVNTAVSTVVGPDDGPLHLRDVLESDGKPAAAMVAPVAATGRPFGALILTREAPFEQRDLSYLTCFARSAAPSLRAIVSEGNIFRQGRADNAGGAADALRYSVSSNAV
jgi:glycosyltransferase involved in cell wall biosynthesis